MENNSLKNMGFIVLEELGVDTSGYKVSDETMSDVYYDLYCNSCQSPNENDDLAEESEIGDYIAQFTTSGRIGAFRWFALTTLYGTDIYKMNDERIRQNSIHRETMQKGSYSLGEMLNHAINTSDEMHSLLREPIVLNTKDLMDIKEYGYLSAMQIHLENFMDLPHVDVIKVHEKKIEYNWSLIQNKDVIIPFIIGSQENIKKYAELASAICGKSKASCAVGIFITRIKPSMDGKEPQMIDVEDKIPVISESPFFTPIV